MPLRAQDVTDKLSGHLDGDGAVEILAMSNLDEARAGDISFYTDDKYAKQLAATQASAVLVPRDWNGECPAPAIIRVDSPNAAFAQVGAWFAPKPIARAPGVHPTAIISPSVTLGQNVHVGPWTVIEDGTVVGDNCIIEAQVFIGSQVRLGDDCHVYPQVTLREGTIIGHRAILHSGVRIGGDGYGFNPNVGADGSITIEKIPQIGIVEIGDDVEIGCNTTIDRARFGRTRIGNSVKIDNLVQIAHNVQVGDYTGIIAQVGIAGSTRIGTGCLLWGQAGLSGHLTIGDRAQVGPSSGLSKNVPPGEYYIGFPALPKREFADHIFATLKIEKLKTRLEKLEAKLEEKLRQSGG